MIIIMESSANEAQIKEVIAEIRDAGLKEIRLSGAAKVAIAAIGREQDLNQERIKGLEGVEKLMEIQEPYELVSREHRPEGSIIRIKGVEIGGKALTIMAGPCSVESEDQFRRIALEVKAAGATILRGGSFKWRTSPHAFQGLGLEGLMITKKIKEEVGLLSATEVLDPRQVEAVCQYSDILQVGTVSMQNYPLLREVGKSKMPVILKRGKWATYNEYLLAAEYIMAEGNENIILCERGIRTFVTETRSTIDINAIPYLKEKTHLPIIGDPSHGTGMRHLVPAISRAFIAAGADGLIIETHYDPEHAKTDADQTISTEAFAILMGEIEKIGGAVGRTI
ncbi:3-deoxy-7-phosphoheptulonate synthase [Candidatus Wirthbacteria bacterium CG2_30_54_11]|uniref:3-deoxy-7-phosphoheptulonate synthase n=1 Tax=Candidatus Wirthbacteria bacterium CG2_30_54_11 TaxID=1817892 RepID=A0A1J5ILP6_9BACT|nr:MAG: 3-deoxy-7-phosphoheptulonate synthase [Candidatus Wirthbacteria bacterium CG2_30_54_11]